MNDGELGMIALLSTVYFVSSSFQFYVHFEEKGRKSNQGRAYIWLDFELNLRHG
jgi:hypothetical protein